MFCETHLLWKTLDPVEYDPQPPFNRGHPRNADAQPNSAATAIMQDVPERAVALARACLAAKNAAA
jgi:hypothetical protein